MDITATSITRPKPAAARDRMIVRFIGRLPCDGTPTATKRWPPQQSQPFAPVKRTAPGYRIGAIIYGQYRDVNALSLRSEYSYNSIRPCDDVRAAATSQSNRRPRTAPRPDRPPIAAYPSPIASSTNAS